MRTWKSTLARIGLPTLLICSFIADGNVCLAQTILSENSPVKLDEYGDLPTDDEAAHLDLFAEKLFNQPKLRGYILAYNEPRMGRGSFLRRIYGVGRYLTEARGIETNRVVVADGGFRENFVTQLWLIPEGAEPPLIAPTLPQPTVVASSAYKFDEECLNCAPAVGLYLYGLDEGLKFYAEELRKNPDSRGLIIVRPDRNVSVRKALKEARSAKSLLVKKYGVDANRIIIKSDRSRNDGTAVAEMWVVPRDAKQAAATSNNGTHPTANQRVFHRNV
jgi:hypothetical protein